MFNLEYYLEKLELLEVTDSITGGAAGSILQIKLDSKDYFFIYCIWRIEQNEKVLVTSSDDNTAIIGKMPLKAKLLEHKKILSIKISKQYDLTIKFEDNYCLKTFCNISYFYIDEKGRNVSNTNWELCLPDKGLIFEVNNNYEIKISDYY